MQGLSPTFHMVSEEMIFNDIFSIFCILIPMATNENEHWVKKIILLKEDHSRNASVKVLSKYLQKLNNKYHFLCSPL